jgi:hypothetical protein
MTIIGFILFLGGLGIAGAIFMGAAPAAITALPVPFIAWIGVAVVGAVLIMFNRRPGN